MVRPKWQEAALYDAEMAAFGSEDSVGARIKAARRSRGFASIPAFAETIHGGEPTAAILANIESGRKVDLNIVHLLNIAMALKVPVSYLLAPITSPNAALDLPGLSDAFHGMTAAEFDAWLAVVPDADYRADNVAERNDRTELQALRELEALKREHRRLRAMNSLRGEPTSVNPAILDDTHARAADVQERITTIQSYLRSAGWQLPEPEA